MRAHLLVVIVVGALIAAIYGQSAGFGYVFDDELCILTPDEMQEGLSARGILWALGSQESSNWFPLTRISWLADVSFFGLDPGPAHLVNALLHGASALMLYAFLLSATGKRWASAAVSIIFAAHPLQVESVAWITERSLLLSTLFLWGAFAAHVAYVRRPGLGRYLTVFLCALLSLLAKPIAVTLPVLLLLVDWWPLGRFHHADAGGQSRSPSSIARQGILAEKAPLVLLSSAFVSATLLSQAAAGSVSSLEEVSVPARLAVAARSVEWHVSSALWPAGLGVYYPMSTHPSSGQTALLVAAIAGGTIAVFFSRRRLPHLLVGWLWFLIALAPVSGLMQTGEQSTADRFAYLPLAGLGMILVWSCEEATRGRKRRLLVVAGSAATLVAFAALSFRQTGFWRDEVSLFSRAAAVAGADSFIIRYHLAEGLERAGDLEGAVTQYRRALSFRRPWAGTHNRLGAVLARLGNTAEAEVQFRAALDLDPRHREARLNLGDLFLRSGRAAEAKQVFLEAARTHPGAAEGFERLANILASQGSTEAAASCAHLATQLAQKRPMQQAQTPLRLLPVQALASEPFRSEKEIGVPSQRQVSAWSLRR